MPDRGGFTAKILDMPLAGAPAPHWSFYQHLHLGSPPKKPRRQPHRMAPQTLKTALGARLYDPKAKVMGMFRGCREISAEQWQSIGFTQFDDPTTVISSELPSPFDSCMYRTGPTDDEFRELFTLQTSYKTWEEANKDMRPVTAKVNKPENFYIFDIPEAKEQQCPVGVVTARGRIVGTYGQHKSVEPAITKNQACQRAVDHLQQVFKFQYDPAGAALGFCHRATEIIEITGSAGGNRGGWVAAARESTGCQP